LARSDRCAALDLSLDGNNDGADTNAADDTDARATVVPLLTDGANRSHTITPGVLHR
jgi:hypothetical protein